MHKAVPLLHNHKAFGFCESQLRSAKPGVRQLLSVLLLIVFLLYPHNRAQAQEYQLQHVQESFAEISEILTGADPVDGRMSLNPRIISGADASREDWPSIAVIALGRDDIALSDRVHCGGTVVNERWVLTAAHCMFDALGTRAELDDISVITGIADLNSNAYVETSIMSIIVHQQYDPTTMYNDIAIIELAEAVSAPVATLFDGDVQTLDGGVAQIAGWGATVYDVSADVGSAYPEKLQSTSVPIVSLDQCNRPASYGGTLQRGQICAGYSRGGADACFGDSGGPLYVLDQDVPVQVGITSFGLGCGQANFYGVYTDLTQYRSWLSQYFEPKLTNSAQATSGNHLNRSEALSGQPAEQSSNLVSNGMMNSVSAETSGAGAFNLLWLGVFFSFACRRQFALRVRKELSLASG